MPSLSISLSPTNIVVKESSSGSCDAGSSDPGTFYTPQLGTGRQSADTEIGQKSYAISSPSAFVALPAPASLTGRLLYVRSKSGGDLDVRVTHATQGTTVYPIASKGMFMIEPSADEGISLVEVQGEGVIEWSLSGSLP